MQTTLAPNSADVSDDFGARPQDVAYLTTVMVNVAFIGEPRSGDWILIDAGIPMNAHRIASFARERFGDAPPRAILLTHGHFDHVGSLHALLRKWPDTPVYAHLLELPYLTNHAAYPPADPSVGGGLMARTSPLLPRRPYDFRGNIMPLPPDGIVPFLPEWEWIHTPGHSPGHVSFFRQSDRTLIAGDAFVTQKQESLWGVITQEHTIHGPPTYFTIDWNAARKSIQRLAELQPRYAITGHGLAVANPRLEHDLNLLVSRFDEFALPSDGRYVRQPALADAHGPTSIPPPIGDMRPKIIAGLALAVAAIALTNRYGEGKD